MLNESTWRGKNVAGQWETVLGQGWMVGVISEENKNFWADLFDSDLFGNDMNNPEQDITEVVDEYLKTRYN
jgi:hypothetical protein